MEHITTDNKNDLGKVTNKSQKVRMRIANDSTYITVDDFKLSYFESEEEYDNEILGKYKGNYVMINKEDYYSTIL